MKIRHPAITKVTGLALSWLLRRWVGTLSFRYRNLTARDVEPRQNNTAGPYLFALWHQDIIALTAHYAGPHLCTMISEHADGQLITEAGRHLRMKAIAGSSTRGGIRALRQMLRQRGPANLVITPDGPRGPVHEVKSGVVYLASRSGLPIVPLGVGYRRAWRLRTWDRMVLPWPCGKVYCVGGAPIHVPANADREMLELYRVQVQDALNHAHDVATWLIERKKASDQVPHTILASEGS